MTDMFAGMSAHFGSAPAMDMTTWLEDLRLDDVEHGEHVDLAHVEHAAEPTRERATTTSTGNNASGKQRQRHGSRRAPSLHSRGSSTSSGRSSFLSSSHSVGSTTASSTHSALQAPLPPGFVDGELLLAPMAEVDEQAPPIREDQSLPCEFAGMLNCPARYRLDELMAWIDHHAVHWHDLPPETMTCWICDRVFRVGGADDLWDNFRRRMTHIRDEHFLWRHEPRTRRDLNVVAHAGQHGFIPDDVYRTWMDYSELPDRLRQPGCRERESVLPPCPEQEPLVHPNLATERRRMRPKGWKVAARH